MVVLEPTQIRRYKTSLVSLMSYKDNRDYAMDVEFSQEQLLEIRPVHCVQRCSGNQTQAPIHVRRRGGALVLSTTRKRFLITCPTGISVGTWKQNAGTPPVRLRSRTSSRASNGWRFAAKASQVRQDAPWRWRKCVNWLI